MAIDGQYDYVADHTEQAVGHLISFFRKPRWMAFVRALVTPIQNLEDVIWAMYSSFDLETATGAQLDIVGSWVGEFRNDRDDAAYRTAIRTRILVRGSHGTIDDLLNILETAEPNVQHVLTEYWPATIVLEWTEDLENLTQLDLHQLVKLAKPAGVKYMTVYAPLAESFFWDDVDDAGATDTLSWSTVAAYPTGGGFLSQVWD